MGKKVQQPTPPDFSGMAVAQGAANAEAARVSGRMSNPNIITPYGTQTVTWGSGTPSSTSTSSGGGHWEVSPSGQQYWIDGGTTNTPTTGGGGDTDQATIRQTLTPAGEQTVKEQQNAELNLARLGNWIVSNEGPGGFKQTLTTPFSFGGIPKQTLDYSGTVSLPQSTAAFQQTFGANPGSVQGAPNLDNYGSAQGLSNSQNPNAISGVQAPNLQKNLDLNGVAALPVNSGMTAQQAIMSRLQPQIAQNRTSEETKLTNQGLRPGGEAYDNAIRLLGQQENEQLTQAALQGLNLDFAANQQGFNQRVQSGEFGNEAQLASFGAGLQNINQINQAAAQNFGQNLQVQQSQNEAIAQRQQAALAQQEAANRAQAQQFGNAQTVQQAQNAALQQNFQNAQTYNQLMNAAQQQQFGQNLQGAQFFNAAQQQALAQALQQREVPLNEIAALLSGSQIQNPQFQAFQGQQVAPAPVMQAGQSQAAWDQQMYQQQVAQRNAMMSGLFGLGGSALGMFGFGGK